MPLYFAYGANMDTAAMALRCPQSRALGVARLPRHRFIITRDGYASVLRDPMATVHGVLWDLGLGDVKVLDRFEEVDRGLYAKISQPVIAAGGPRRALIYVGTASEPGTPRPGYLEAVIASAESWNLPEAYRREMKRFVRSAGAISAAAATTQPVPAVRPIADAPRSTVGQAVRASQTWGRGR
jgi:broad specificity phosphatase PhoE